MAFDLSWCGLFSTMVKLKSLRCIIEKRNFGIMYDGSYYEYKDFAKSRIEYLREWTNNPEINFDMALLGHVT